MRRRDWEQPVRVLAVEDSPEDAALVRSVLVGGAGLRFELTVRDRLQAGLDHLEREAVDIVLLDFSLPDSKGLDTFRRVNAEHPEVPIIVLTSLEDDAVAVQAVAEGAQDYLPKRYLDGRLLTRSIRYALERHRSEEALRESEERYALAIRGANDGLWDWNLSSGTLYLSPRWKMMLGYGIYEVGERPDDWFRKVHPDDVDELRSALQAHFEGDDEHFEHEHRMITRGGEIRWMLTRGVAVRNEDGKVIRMAGSLTDVTARKSAEQQLVYDAFHDGLTGLANRALFIDRLGVVLAARRRQPHFRFAVLFLDLDRFKNINDSLGHTTGDKLLQDIARRIERTLRPGDTIARLGGDEFAILLSHVDDLGDAVRVAERIQEIISTSVVISPHEVYVTASIGIALSSEETRGPEDILRDADIAMYRAKAAGRSRYEVFDSEMHRHAVRLLALETELRRAIEREDFVMHYQPIVALATGRIVGFEGLVRWNHPERGLIAPSHFIGLAEETGLIVPLCWYTLRECCGQASRWQAMFPQEPPLFISVNVSGKLFMQPDAVERLVGILDVSELPPGSLRLEVTENVVVDHGDEVMAKLTRLRALGVQLSIDDFGTGYSSLSYLQRFQYDSLKIDRSFVSTMGLTRDSRNIVKTILNLADDLGIGVVAEGVETEEQAIRLRQMECPLGQGFWFARPLNHDAATELIAAPPRWYGGPLGPPGVAQ
ncbi:MAG TPA: EAL domain-containing protein [Thermoanaerobaculales bacterium]|nr:EAL domain-containing protein [Thermoanaerobaculales bacterium]